MTHDLTRETLDMLEYELHSCKLVSEDKVNRDVDDEELNEAVQHEALYAYAAECVRIVDAMLPCLTNRCDHYEWADCGQAMADAFNRSPLASAYAQARAAQTNTSPERNGNNG